MGKGAGKGGSGGGDAPDIGIPYLQQSLTDICGARAGWLSVFFAGLLLTMIIMQSFEEVLEANVQLSFFVPLIVGHAGNTGSQAVSTVIRALALAQAALSDSLHITRTEFIAGGAIGLYLAVWAYSLGHWVFGLPLRVMFSVAVSLPSVSCVANLIGAGLPLICEKFNLDPAVIAAPMMTTLVDCSGILTYLMISQFIMGSPEANLEAEMHHIQEELRDEYGVSTNCPNLTVLLEEQHHPHHPEPEPAPMPAPTPHSSPTNSSVSGEHAGDDVIDIGMTLMVIIMVGITVLWAKTSYSGHEVDADSQAAVDSKGPEADSPVLESNDSAETKTLVTRAQIEAALQECMANLQANEAAEQASPRTSRSPQLTSCNAEVEAGEIVKLLATRLGVRMIMQSEADKHTRYLRTIPLLKHLSKEELNQIVQSLQVCQFIAGQTVLAEGEDGQDMYIVESGHARCVKEGVNNGEPIMHYGAGDFFGERALLANEPRAATIVADDNLCCLRLGRSAYEMILQSGNVLQDKIETLQQNYYQHTGTAIGRGPGTLGDLNGPTVAQAVRSIFQRRKSVEVLSPLPSHVVQQSSSASVDAASTRTGESSHTSNPVHAGNSFGPPPLDLDTSIDYGKGSSKGNGNGNGNGKGHAMSNGPPALPQQRRVVSASNQTSSRPAALPVEEVV